MNSSLPVTQNALKRIPTARFNRLDPDLGSDESRVEVSGSSHREDA
jgi:hypothetical protein